MEEVALLDLLECPLCFKQLDGSAKVLPCQHAFCKACLQKQEAPRSQLLCPECGAPVRARSVEELPANLSLARLLGGLRGSMGPGRGRQSARYMVPLVRDNATVREGQHQESLCVHNRERQGHIEFAARTLYSHREDTMGELDLSLGDNINSRHKVDDSWHHADTNNSSGPVTVNTVQGVVHQMPQSLQQSQPPALCRALYDFNPKEMDLEDCRDCLTFLKGDILTVIRRVNEHWIEAKLGDKLGIFPLQFTEPNAVAAKLLEGKSRKGSDTAEFCQRIGGGGNDKAADAPNRTAHFRAPQVPGKTPLITSLPLPGQGKQAGISGTLYHPSKGQPSSIGALNSLNHQGQAQQSHFSAPPAPRGAAQASRVTSHHAKRRSDTANIHQSQGDRTMSSETPPTVAMALVNPQAASASTQQLSISVCAALYSYKPRRPEELELRKGEMVGVYGKFKEGWLRGLSLRSGKVGILPGNYVTPVLRTSARLLEAKAASASSSAVAGKRPAASRNPTVVLALDRVNTDGTAYSTGPAPSVPNGAQHVMSSAGAGRSPLYSSQGWDTVRRAFNPHRGSSQQRNHYAPNSNSSLPSHSQNFAQVQSSGYSPALQRRKHSSSILPKPGRPLGWMSDATAPSAAAILKDRDFTAPKEATFDRQLSNGPHSILVRPDSHKNNTDKPTKSVRFLTEEDSPPRLQTSSWSSGSQAACTGRPGPPPLEVWAPSLTLGRDGPGIILKEGKVPVLRKGLETAISDNPNYNQKPSLAQSSLSAVSAQFSPSRHRVVATYLAQTDTELSLLQGEPVLVHRPRPDGRVLVTQESSGQTGLFHTSVLQALERLS